MAVAAGEVDIHNVMPPQGVVPDTVTAVRIAEAVLSPIYGEDQINSQQPFKAVLKNGVWTVEGTLPEDARGGVAEIDISQKSGAILRISHGR